MATWVLVVPKSMANRNSLVPWRTSGQRGMISARPVGRGRVQHFEVVEMGAAHFVVGAALVLAGFGGALVAGGALVGAGFAERVAVGPEFQVDFLGHHARVDVVGIHQHHFVEVVVLRRVGHFHEREHRQRHVGHAQAAHVLALRVGVVGALVVHVVAAAHRHPQPHPDAGRVQLQREVLGQIRLA